MDILVFHLSQINDVFLKNEVAFRLITLVYFYNTCQMKTNFTYV